MRSNRLDASLGSLCRRTVRATEAGSQIAASSRMSVLSGRISVAEPPITPARPIGPDSSHTTTSSGSSSRSTSSKVDSFSPALARRTLIPPCSDGVS
jgi:hypothetical protein